MKLLGVDYGRKRVGLATLDASVGLAFPLRAIEGGSDSVVASEVMRVAAEEGVATIVVGMPKALDEAHESPMMKQVEEFVRVLRAMEVAGLEGVTVITHDERMTSAMVVRQQRELGLEKGHVDVDASAAAVMLQSYWDSNERNVS